MAIDSSIYFKQQSPDVFGSISSGVESGMKMSDLIKQRQLQNKQLEEDQAIKNSYKNNVVSNPDGSRSLNQKAVLSDLYRINPMKAMEQEKQFSQLSREQEMQKFDLQKKRTDAMHGLVWSVSDPQSYSRFLENGTKLGLVSPGEFPSQYDPNFMKRVQMATLTAKDQLDQQQKSFDNNLKQNEFGLKKQELGLKKEKQALEIASPTGFGKLTEGEKAVDKDYAKDFNDFTGGGEAKAIDAINKLKFYRDQMAKDNGLVQAGGGPISGSLPDMFRTQQSISQRDNIVTVANSALKATFGGQLSDGERKAASNEFYNDKLDNSENLKIMDRKIQELENGLAAQKAKAQHYIKNRSLSGFNSTLSTQNENKNVKTINGKSYQKVPGGWVEVN